MRFKEDDFWDETELAYEIALGAATVICVGFMLVCWAIWMCIRGLILLKRIPFGPRARKWTIWFAWYPVNITEAGYGESAWLEFVDRRADEYETFKMSYRYRK